MIEIKCTEAEKGQLIFVLSSGGQCPFSLSPDVHCKSVAGKCEGCIEENIKWKTERTEG